ncbi:uncharacterized protein LOC144020380 [Festucalex cinctus]
MAIALKVYVSMTATVFLLAVTGGKRGSQEIGDHQYWEDMQARIIHEHVGESVRIECPYPSSHDKDDQFLCKGDNPVSCERVTDKTKILRVNKRKKHFSVHISDLSKADSGTYWCRSNIPWKKSEYTKVQLHVADEATTRSRRPAVRVTAATVVMISKSSMWSSTPTPSRHSVVKYINVAVLVSPILLAVPLLALVVFIYKRTSKQGGSSVQGRHDGPNNQAELPDNLYEEIQMQSQQGNAMVNPPEPIHYSMINFQQESSNISTAHNSHLEAEENRSDSSGSCVIPSVPAVADIYSTVAKQREP